MKKGSYHGVKFMLPDNISIRCIKRVIDSGIGSYPDIVQTVIDFISQEKRNAIKQYQNETKQNSI